MTRATAIAAMLLGAASAAAAQTAPTTTPPAVACAVVGSPGVTIEGAPMLRLGDVAACPGLRYEVIPGLTIDGQPAVRLLPSDGCAAGGAASVMINGAPATRAGDC